MDKRNRQMAKRERRSGACGRSVFGMAYALGMAVLLSSCMHDDTPPCEMSPEDGYTLNIRLSAGSLATRAEGDKTSQGTGAENFINIGSDDYAVFILDQDGRYVQRFEPGSVSLKTTAQGNVYDLRGFFRPAETMKSIQLMVAANWETDFGYSYNDFEDVLKMMDAAMGDDLDAAEDETAKASVPTLPERIYANENIIFTLPTDGGTSWVPDAGDVRRTGIPMFGMMSESVVLNRSSMTTEIPAAIPMQRSLAKIEIWDMVEGKSADITKCVFTKYNARGRFIPDGETNPDWNVDTKQVVKPSLPSDAAITGTGLTFAQGKREVTINGKEYKGDEAKDYFVVYVPEMDLATFAEGERPVIEVYLKDAIEPSAIIQLADYDGGKKPVPESEYDALLRNHSYRYDVTGVGIDAEITLLIETPNWDPDDDEYWYEDTRAGYANNGRFKWEWTAENKDTEETILNGQEEDRRVVVVSRENGIEGIATFTLAEPARGSWTLSISPDDGTPNHWFRIDVWDEDNSAWITEDLIEDADNLIATSVSGKIASKNDVDKPQQVRIRIVAQELQYTGKPYTARLLMNVTTFDGRMTEVNLTSADPMTVIGDNSHYIIKQYPTSKE